MAYDCPQPSASRGGLAPWQRSRIDSFLAAHLDGPIRVAALAAQAPLRASRFRSAFRETFGEAPHAYVMRKRLERAQQLMLTTVEPLSQVAFACGLADQAHLTKLFRRLVGVSPSAWRRRHAAGPDSAGLGEPQQLFSEEPSDV